MKAELKKEIEKVVVEAEVEMVVLTLTKDEATTLRSIVGDTFVKGCIVRKTHNQHIYDALYPLTKYITRQSDGCVIDFSKE